MKNIIAILNLLEQQLAQLNLETVSAIERDLALEKLRNIYDLLLGVTTAAEEQEPLAESVIELIEELVDEVEEFDNAEEENTPEESAEVAEEPAQEEPEESVIELIEDLVEEVEEFDNSEEEVAEVAEPEPEPEPKPEIEVRPKTKLAHSAILALYDDEEDETEEEVAPAEEETNAVEEATDEDPEEVVIDMTEPIVEVEPEEVAEGAEPAPAVEPVAEPAAAEEEEEQPVKVVLGEVLGADQTTLADRIAADAPADVASVANAQKSLVEMIGLNDKFILLRDLFHNNHDYYEAAIDQLDEFEDIDEAMLFIHDNFQWNPNSEGAKLLVELLSNKLL
ncbi:MAG: hypothetical protein E7134_04515 [Rikenellaceae bacterium]|nr:hypothetical protein [Rikenellaceae bacterium]